MQLCKYRHMFGEEGKGAHALRLFNVAVVDVVLTWVAAMAIARLWQLELLHVFVALMALSVVVHKAFCVETTLVKLLF
jgi:hypothetical protein